MTTPRKEMSPARKMSLVSVILLIPLVAASMAFYFIFIAPLQAISPVQANVSSDSAYSRIEILYPEIDEYPVHQVEIDNTNPDEPPRYFVVIDPNELLTQP